MASRQRKSVQIQPESPLESEDHNTHQSSHDQSTIDVIKTAQNLVSTSKKRRDTKRKTIEREHEKRTKDIMARIDTLFETRKIRVTKSQKAQWDRLEALNKKRQILEGLILGSMKSIEVHTINISSELSAMFTGRIEEIEERASE